MNILICTDNLFQVNGYTLVPRYLARELRKLGLKVKICCTGLPKNLFEDEKKTDFIKVKAVDTILDKRPILQVFDEFKPDAILTNGIGSIDSLATNYGNKNHIPVCATVHTRYMSLIKEIAPLSKFYPSFLLNFIQRIVIRTVKKADIVIALSPEMKEYLYSLNFKNVEVISNGVDLDKFKPRPPMKENPKTVNLLYVGNIEKRKNQKYFLEVGKYLPDNFIINLVGGLSWDKGYYEDFVEAYNEYRKERSNIVWHGKVDVKNIPKIYHQNDIFISASLMEAQSLVLIEALVSGLVVVRLSGKNNQGVTDHLYNAIHLPVDAPAEMFAKSIVSVVENYHLYKEMYDNAIKERENYSWEKNAVRFRNLLTYYISLNK